MRVYRLALCKHRPCGEGESRVPTCRAWIVEGANCRSDVQDRRPDVQDRLDSLLPCAHVKQNTKQSHQESCRGQVKSEGTGQELVPYVPEHPDQRYRLTALRKDEDEWPNTYALAMLQDHTNMKACMRRRIHTIPIACSATYEKAFSVAVNPADVPGETVLDASGLIAIASAEAGRDAVSTSVITDYAGVSIFVP